MCTASSGSTATARQPRLADRFDSSAGRATRARRDRARRCGTDGAWTGTHAFTAGTYQYKFIVDGTQWIADPDNPNSVDDGFGGKNSLYTCQP